MTTPSSKEMTAKERVLARYPKARPGYSSWEEKPNNIFITTPAAGRIVGGRLSHYFATEAEAWADAASRLPVAAAPDESQKLREELAADDDRMGEMARQVAEQEKVIEELVEALEGIRRYGRDTLSGRVDGPDDREWQREGVRVMTNRANAALCAEQYRKQKGRK